MRSEQARAYIAEAVATYRSGAYRACIVTTWIAAVYDIIDKVRELSLNGDKAATRQIEKLTKLLDQYDKGEETAVQAILKFERDVLRLHEISSPFSVASNSPT